MHQNSALMFLFKKYETVTKISSKSKMTIIYKVLNLKHTDNYLKYFSVYKWKYKMIHYRNTVCGTTYLILEYSISKNVKSLIFAKVKEWYSIATYS